MHRAVAPSSGFPTDRRRSECLSGSLQPRKPRTRCGRDSTPFEESREEDVRHELSDVGPAEEAEGKADEEEVAARANSCLRRQGSGWLPTWGRACPTVRQRYAPSRTRAQAFARVAGSGAASPRRVRSTLCADLVARTGRGPAVSSSQLKPRRGGGGSDALPTAKGLAIQGEVAASWLRM